MMVGAAFLIKKYIGFTSSLMGNWNFDNNVPKIWISTCKSSNKMKNL